MPDATGAAGDEAGAALLSLIHSFAHRLIRLAVIHAGIDRNALSELLVTSHLGFYMYAAARGNFVFGGLQAVFESEFDRLLYDFAFGDHRCASDPGCRARGRCLNGLPARGGAFLSYYNQYLDRGVLTGAGGLL